MRSGITPKLQQECSLALADPWISANDQTDVREKRNQRERCRDGT